MGRKEDIVDLFKDVDSKEIIIKLVDDMLFLEEQLDELRKVPHIRCHPVHKELQKRTEAGKLYKEYLQQYNNIVKGLSSVLYKNEVEVNESPLRDYFNKLRAAK